MTVEEQPLAPLQITSMIHVIRGQRVMLDADIAHLYGVTTKRLNEQVSRNAKRFPGDFAFRLNQEEALALRSQIATSNVGRGGRRSRPMAFTEHGAVMLASVLSSPIAVAASIQVVRAFVQLRGMLSSHADLVRQLRDLEARYDAQFKEVFDAIRELMRPIEEEKPRQIGFRSAAVRDQSRCSADCRLRATLGAGLAKSTTCRSSTLGSGSPLPEGRGDRGEARSFLPMPPAERNH